MKTRTTFTLGVNYPPKISDNPDHCDLQIGDVIEFEFPDGSKKDFEVLTRNEINQPSRNLSREVFLYMKPAGIDLDDLLNSL